MRDTRLALPVVAVAIVLGCAIAPIPELARPESSAIGIEMTLRAPIGIFSASPDQVFFARIDAPDARTYQVMPSNYTKGGRAYLLNAPPATYIAVGAFRVVQDHSTGRVTRFRTSFSPELAEQTRVTVRDGEFVFMGSYVVDQKVASGPGEMILLGVAGDALYHGTMREGKKDEAARTAFFSSAREDLAGSGWVARLR
jgi:hypothetical protein